VPVAASPPPAMEAFSLLAAILGTAGIEITTKLIDYIVKHRQKAEKRPCCAMQD
jgi:hypothetical protein